jgi:hypothetical protein
MNDTNYLVVAAAMLASSAQGCTSSNAASPDASTCSFDCPQSDGGPGGGDSADTGRSDDADAGNGDVTDGGMDETSDVARPDADGSPETGIADGSVADAPPPLVSLKLSTGALMPSFDPAVTDYAMTSLNALYPVEVTAIAGDPKAPLLVHGAPALSAVPTSFKLGAGEDFTVVAGGRTYTVHYVPPDLPAYTVTSTPAAGTENVLLTPSSTYLLIVDRAGDPLYYRSFAPSMVENFLQFRLPSGETRYSTLVGASAGSWALGTIHLMDARLNDLGDVQLLPSGSHDVLPAEGHDFILLDDDHYVAMSYVQRTTDLSELNPSWSSKAVVMNAVVQEVDSGQVLFEWDSANVPALYADSTYSNSFTSTAVSDYLHLNSLVIDPVDGNFIFSFRHTSSVVKVDRNSGEILWTLGGKEDDFGLTSDQVFSFQHYVRRQPDGSLWVFDNGNNLHQTRIVSFVLDETNKQVVSFTDVYDKPADQPQTAFMGSYGVLDTSRYLFGWGGWNSSAIAPAATEVTAGSVSWSLTFTSPNVFSYRALPISAF